ncbi:MAG: hypothetical protein PVH05_07240, partial [Burkholderiales bacterium]
MNAYRQASRALRSALRNLFHPAILGVMLLPAIAALILWAGLSWWFWDSWSNGIETMLVNLTSHGWLARLDAS